MNLPTDDLTSAVPPAEIVSWQVLAWLLTGLPHLSAWKDAPQKKVIRSSVFCDQCEPWSAEPVPRFQFPLACRHLFGSMKCSLSKADWAVRTDSPQADVSFCLFKGAFALNFLLLYLVLDAQSLAHDRLQDLQLLPPRSLSSAAVVFVRASRTFSMHWSRDSENRWWLQRRLSCGTWTLDWLLVVIFCLVGWEPWAYCKFVGLWPWRVVRHAVLVSRRRSKAMVPSCQAIEHHGTICGNTWNKKTNIGVSLECYWFEPAKGSGQGVESTKMRISLSLLLLLQKTVRYVLAALQQCRSGDM